MFIDGNLMVFQVDMSKVNLNVLKPWISDRISELLGMEDDVLNEFVFNQLEADNVSFGIAIVQLLKVYWSVRKYLLAEGFLHVLKEAIILHLFRHSLLSTSAVADYCLRTGPSRLKIFLSSCLFMSLLLCN